MEGIYVLHLHQPIIPFKLKILKSYGGSFHYVGMTNDLSTRLKHHFKYGGSKKIRIVKKLNIMMDATIVKLEATQQMESLITKDVERYCITCRKDDLKLPSFLLGYGVP